jgi:hypothetical protein
MSQYPPVQPGPMAVRPHRGALVLVMGILGIVICFILGIIAWVMGSSDLREMDAGRMDPSGRGITTAGKILGIVSVVLAVVGVGVWVLIMALGLIGAAAGAASSGGGTP